MSNFGDIDNTEFGFGSNRDDPEEPCFCNLAFSIEVTIIENFTIGVNTPKPFTYYLAVSKHVSCETDAPPADDYVATFTPPKTGFNPRGGVLRIRWTRTKMCGECTKKPCQLSSKLCGESGYYTGGSTTKYKQLWKLRSTLDQDEARVKQILNDMVRNKKCKYDKDCGRAKIFCKGTEDASPGMKYKGI